MFEWIFVVFFIYMRLDCLLLVVTRLLLWNISIGWWRGSFCQRFLNQLGVGELAGFTLDQTWDSFQYSLHHIRLCPPCVTDPAGLACRVGYTYSTNKESGFDKTELSRGCLTEVWLYDDTENAQKNVNKDSVVALTFVCFWSKNFHSVPLQMNEILYIKKINKTWVLQDVKTFSRSIASFNQAWTLTVVSQFKMSFCGTTTKGMHGSCWGCWLVGLGIGVRVKKMSLAYFTEKLTNDNMFVLCLLIQ